MPDPIELGAHVNMTVEDAIAYSARSSLTEVLIVGYDGDGDLVILSSKMQRKDALWLSKRAEEWALSSDGDGP